MGNRTQRVDQAGTHTYAYDDVHRLTSVTYPGPSTTSYAFDDFGNRTSMTDAGGTTTYAYDDNDRITSVTPPSPAPAKSTDEARTTGEGSRRGQTIGSPAWVCGGARFNLNPPRRIRGIGGRYHDSHHKMDGRYRSTMLRWRANSKLGVAIVSSALFSTITLLYAAGAFRSIPSLAAGIAIACGLTLSVCWRLAPRLAPFWLILFGALVSLMGAEVNLFIFISLIILVSTIEVIRALRKHYAPKSPKEDSRSKPVGW
ncbi:MAG: hypothetical protein IT303_02175 [Dehalococcoidia bacterium]|nr:hypothetical protein [Dehalococcoidia bacterium]